MKLHYPLAALTLAAPFLSSASAQTSSVKKCPFVSEEITTPVTYELPISVLSHPKSDLPLEFRGLSPTVTRKTLPYGSKPKVTVTRYSHDAPSIEYDSDEQRVVITGSHCSASSTNDSSNTGGNGQGNTATESGACSAFLTNTSPYAKNKYFMAASLVAAGLTQSPVMAAGAVLAGMVPGANAQDDDTCMSSVQVVVEAPASYEGAVETCWREVNDTAICPEPFPTYPTCDDPAPECPVAVVGGGAGGLYTALRLVDEGQVEASDVCVFEMTERVGGRIFSLRGLGPEGDLTVDAGGYRTWPQFTPTAHALITEYLEIPMDCYDDTEPCEVFNIITPEGKKGGFTKFVEEMMQRLSDGGACFYPYHELESMTKIALENPSEQDAVVSKQFLPSQENYITELHFANGVTARATGTTILNIPQRPLLNMLRKSDFDAKGLIDADTMDALHSVQTVIATKFYLYYPRGHVWWRMLEGLRQGEFESSGDARNMLLAGRYHDGQVECDDENDPDTCHGFLLATYANDLSGNKAQFFRRYQREREEPVTFFEAKDLEGRQILEHAHSRLVNYHLYEKADANYTGFEASAVFDKVQPPTFGILSTWNTAIPWAGGAWHAWTDTSNIELAKQPFVEDNIFVVNEAYSLLQGWAEGSIKLADEILEEHFGVPRPWDFPVVDINQLVRQTNSEECVEGEPENGGGGSSNQQAGGGGGGDDGAAAAVLCFAGDSLVEMADGSLKAIQDIEEGDVVSTGTVKGAGVVTQALKHPVGRTVPVAALSTQMGELVGTPDHPVLHGNDWIEFQQLPHKELVLSSKHIDVFYNLEIDADDVEGSSHSYVVNGIVASGLGDNVMLNALFARQKEWKSSE